jgi:hypothetical protein
MHLGLAHRRLHHLARTAMTILGCYPALYLTEFLALLEQLRIGAPLYLHFAFLDGDDD